MADTKRLKLRVRNKLGDLVLVEVLQLDKIRRHAKIAPAGGNGLAITVHFEQLWIPGGLSGD